MPFAPHRPPGSDEAGFTLLEMMLTVTILASVFLALSYVMFGSLNALGASRQRSVFVEVANKEMELLRSLPYDEVGVKSNDLATYGGTPPRHENRDAVVLDVGSLAPPAVSVVTTSSLRGISLPYTVRRWVTWTDPAGGADHKLKRLHVQLEWTENTRAQRRLDLTSVLFPGNVGVSGSNTDPTASFTFTPTTGIVALTTSVTFTATATDPDPGPSFSYLWNFGDGGIATGATVTHVFTSPGNPWSVVLVVSDGQGGSSVVTKPVTVAALGAANVAPTSASFTATPTSGTGPLTVNVTGTATDPDNTSSQLTYLWDFGDGTVLSTSSNAVPHTYAAVSTPTSYVIAMRVTDPSGASSPPATPVTVTVTPGACAITSARFSQQSNPTDNNVKVPSNGNGKPSNGSRDFTFYVRTTAGCTSVAGRLPLVGKLVGGPSGVSLLPVSGAPSGYQDWRNTGSTSGSDAFDLANGARRTWDVWSPAATGAVALSPAFTVTLT